MITRITVTRVGADGRKAGTFDFNDELPEENDFVPKKGDLTALPLDVRRTIKEHLADGDIEGQIASGDKHRYEWRVVPS